MRPFALKTEETKHDWFVIDAAGERLGTLAVRIARVLAGRQKPSWTPHTDNGDHVVVLNADKIELGGKKWTQKVYYRHSGFPGGLREETAAHLHARRPTQLIERAVRGMLAPNRLRAVRLNRLKVYAGDAHPHAAQQLQPLG